VCSKTFQVPDPSQVKYKWSEQFQTDEFLEKYDDSKKSTLL
jgi:hypothetical protein